MWQVPQFIPTFVLAVYCCLPFCACSQAITGIALRKLPATINTDFEESKPITTRSGDSLYFARTQYPGNKGGELAGQDVWMSSRNGDGNWTLADNQLPGLNDIMPNVIIGVAGDDSGIFHLRYMLEGDQRCVLVHFSAYGHKGLPQFGIG